MERWTEEQQETVWMLFKLRAEKKMLLKTNSIFSLTCDPVEDGRERSIGGKVEDGGIRIETVQLTVDKVLSANLSTEFFRVS